MGARRIGHGLAAAGSVVLGAAVAVGINIGTGHPAVAIVVGVVVLVALWAGLEAWRAVHAESSTSSDRPRKSVKQRARNVAGRLTGARGSGQETDVKVEQRMDDVLAGGEVIGYEGDPPVAPALSQTADVSAKTEDVTPGGDVTAVDPA